MFVRAGVALGVVVGVRDGVVLGVFDGVFEGVVLGVPGVVGAPLEDAGGVGPLVTPL
ncbi:MAG TPA: hypothetical protein VGC45_07960 [Gryllotalpicola sp.]